MGFYLSVRQNLGNKIYAEQNALQSYNLTELSQNKGEKVQNGIQSEEIKKKKTVAFRFIIKGENGIF